MTILDFNKEYILFRDSFSDGVETRGASNFTAQLSDRGTCVWTFVELKIKIKSLDPSLKEQVHNETAGVSGGEAVLCSMWVAERGR